MLVSKLGFLLPPSHAFAGTEKTRLQQDTEDCLVQWGLCLLTFPDAPENDIPQRISVFGHRFSRFADAVSQIALGSQVPGDRGKANRAFIDEHRLGIKEAHWPDLDTGNLEAVLLQQGFPSALRQGLEANVQVRGHIPFDLAKLLLGFIAPQADFLHEDLFGVFSEVLHDLFFVLVPLMGDGRLDDGGRILICVGELLINAIHVQVASRDKVAQTSRMGDSSSFIESTCIGIRQEDVATILRCQRHCTKSGTEGREKCEVAMASNKRSENVLQRDLQPRPKLLTATPAQARCEFQYGILIGQPAPGVERFRGLGTPCSEDLHKECRGREGGEKCQTAKRNILRHRLQLRPELLPSSQPFPSPDEN